MTADQFGHYPSLRGTTALITGGGSGIGATIVEHFARQGARVAFFDVSEETSNELVGRLATIADPVPVYLHCDLTDISSLQRRIREVEATVGPVQVLVNNAGRDDRHAWEKVTPEYWDASMAVNLRHHFFAMQSVAEGMKARMAGSIINVSSISWLIPSTGLPAYVAAKAAIVGLTRTMAHELGGSGIRVNCVLPGAILTERQRRLWWTPEYELEIMSSQAIKRALKPEDVARLILFLAADDSSGITNQSFIVDGGWV